MSKRISKADSLLACILDNASVSMLCVDSDLQVVLAGRNWRARLRGGGKKRGLRNVFGKSPQRDELQELVATVFQTREPVVGRRLQDRNRHYQYGIIPFVWRAEVTYAILVLRDITEEIRLSEQVRDVQHRLSSILESASDLVVSLDLSGRIVTWNNAARSLSGLFLPDVTGRKLSKFCPKESATAMAEVIARTLKTKEVNTARLRLHGKGDEVCIVDWAFSPMTDQSGTVSGIVAVGRDLTEQLETEARLQQADRLAALGVMAGGVAHEIRNPLAVSSVAAQLLMERPLDRETQLECAEKIDSGIRRATGIIENLLRFARPSTPGRRSRLDARGLVEDAIKLTENQRKLAKVKLHLSLGKRAHHVFGNRTLLLQAFVNVLLNAINAMAGGGVLSVSLARKKDRVVARVADTGGGIAQRDLKKVFDPFFTRMPVGKGTGLGLSITYSIFEQHDGDISVSSSEGRGTVVTVSLPTAGKAST